MLRIKKGRPGSHHRHIQDTFLPGWARGKVTAFYVKVMNAQQQHKLSQSADTGKISGTGMRRDAHVQRLFVDIFMDF